MLYNRSMDNCNEPKPVFKVEQLESQKFVLAFTTNGLRTEYDMKPVTQAAETKTSIEVDDTGRNFIYNAEDKTYTISASALASILHLAEIGDVNTEGVEDGSLLIYDKELAKWKVWGASTNTAQNLNYVIGANDGNDPVVLTPPGNPNQYYQLGWAAGDKVKFFQIPEVATAPVDASNYKYQLYEDPNTHQIVKVKVASS